MGEVNSSSQEHVLLKFVLTALLLLLLIKASQGTTASDVEALLAFKQQLNSDALQHWIGDNPCNWTGIHCGGPSNTSVVTLSLAKMNLTGTLDPMVGNLSSLRTLDLSQNSFSGPIPSELRNCHGLAYIDLSWNSFDGEFSALFDLKNLTVLNLSQNRLSDILLPNVGTLQSLQVLNLSRNINLYGEMPQELGNCTSLQILDLSNNNFSGAIPSPIFHLEQLRCLVLKGNVLNGTLQDMESTAFGLKRLALTRNHLSGQLPTFISNLTELRLLDLGRNQFTGSIPASLSGLKNLKVLDLSQNMLSGGIPTEIGQLSAMRKLLLHTNALGGPIPRELFNCRNLTSLLLHHNQLISSIPREIGSLVLLASLQLHDNRLTGSIPAELANCSLLADINMSTNAISGGLPPELGTLKILSRFSVANNFLNGVIPSQLSSMPSLEYIVLSHNGLTGAIPDNFSSSNDLLNLELAGNYLTGPMPPTLGILRRLQKVDVSTNQLSGDLSGFADFFSTGNKINQLQCIMLYDNRLSGNLFSNFTCMDSLLTLDLHGNELDGPIPSRFGELFQVSYIDLSSNQFGGAIPPELGNCQYLTTLNLSFNRLEDAIPAGIAKSWGTLNESVVADFSSNNLIEEIPLSLNLGHLRLNVSNNNLSGSIPGLLQHLGPTSFLRNPSLCGPPMKSECTQAVAEKEKKKGCDVKYIVIGVVLGCWTTGFLVLVFCLKGRTKTWLSQHCRRGVQVEGIANSKSSVTSISNWFGDTCSNQQASIKPPKLSPTLSDLSQATEGFSSDRIIGDGGFGKVYKGVLSDGTAVAIKKLTEDGYQGEREFDAELQTLGSIRHQNLVRLYGYCSNHLERLLIYEYMPNNSLDVWLHSRTEGMEPLPWGVRMIIAKDVARGLTFLHHFCIPKIVHRDLKASNILLDANFNARLGDFGLARHLNTYESHISTSVAGSLGYIAPEYAQSWRVTTRGDVFSFGVVMLELLSGKRPACASYKPIHGGNLVGWVQYLFRTKRILDLFFDASVYPVRGSALEEELMSVLDIALRCTHEDPSKRPVMLEVLRILEVDH